MMSALKPAWHHPGAADWRRTRSAGMSNFQICAAMLATAALVTVESYAKDATPAPAPDPKATEVIRELGLVESPTALRDQKGWKAPKRIVMFSGTPLGELQATVPGVE